MVFKIPAEKQYSPFLQDGDINLLMYIIDLNPNISHRRERLEMTV